MKNSLFYKYYLRISAIILVSFLIIGVTLFFFVWKYSADEKQKQLLVGANRVSSLTTTLSDSFYLSYERPYRNSLQFITEYLDSDIYVADLNGNVLVDSYSSKDDKGLGNKKQNTISQTAIKIITEKGIYKETGSFFGFFDHTNYIVGVPFLIADNKFGGVVILSSGANRISSLILDIMQMLCVAIVLALIISYLWLYFATKKLIKPLKAMSNAAKSFANGRFDERIFVEGFDEIADLSISFNNMASSLAALEDMRSSFISDVSHELKTPMTTISGFIDGILDGTISYEKQGYYLNIVSGEIKRLSRLVNSLLQIARINSGKLSIHKTEFDVGALLLTVADSLELSTKDKNVKIVLDLPETRALANADYDAVYRVVYNLCENAVKFSFPDSSIHLKLVRDDKKIYISVKNVGDGISAEDIPYVFDRFYKGDKSRGLDKQGVGLGLYISKQIISMHSESIWAVSKKGEYAEFIFTLTPIS